MKNIEPRTDEKPKLLKSVQKENLNLGILSGLIVPFIVAVAATLLFMSEYHKSYIQVERVEIRTDTIFVHDTIIKSFTYKCDCDKRLDKVKHDLWKNILAIRAYDSIKANEIR